MKCQENNKSYDINGSRPGVFCIEEKTMMNPGIFAANWETFAEEVGRGSKDNSHQLTKILKDKEVTMAPFVPPTPVPYVDDPDLSDEDNERYQKMREEAEKTVYMHERATAVQ